MKPQQSYRIWFSPRSGSTLLCKGLEETGIAGKPGEFFTLFEFNSLREKYKVETYPDLKRKLWQEGTSANGVFGIKIVNDQKVFDEIYSLKTKLDHRDSPEYDFMDEIFPKCKDIYLTRRNKIRQAVSWWKAIKDEVWHIEPGQNKQLHGQEFYQKNYDFAALKQLFKEAILHECSIQEHFTKLGIIPLTIVYEDMVKDFEGTIKKILTYLELDNKELRIEEMYYTKTADSESEKWVQRFSEEIKK